MSKQVTVRLPDALVDFIDERVHSGEAASRAAVVSAAVERERRRRLADRDVVILTTPGRDEDLDELAVYAATVALHDLA